MTKQESAAKIFELMRRYNVKSRFVVSAFDTDLTLTESHLLVELDSRPQFSVSELCVSLRLDKSTISRSLRGLVDRGLLKEAPSKGDLRRKLFVFTADGRRLRQELDQAAANRVGSFVANLSTKESVQLHGYLKFLMDREGAPVMLQRSGELPILVEMRRASRVWGFLGRGILGEPVSVPAWQILSEIRHHDSRATPSILARRLGLSLATISLNVTRLQKLKLVVRSKSDSDGRSVRLKLSRKGDEQLERIRTNASQRIAAALEPLSEESLADFLRLLAKFAAEPINEVGDFIKGQGEARKLSTPNEFHEGRAFLVEKLVNFGLHRNMPATILAEENICMGYYVKTELAAVAELRRAGDFQELVHYVLDSEKITRDDESIFMHSVAEASKATGATSIRIDRGSKAAAIARELGAKDVASGLRLEVGGE